MECVLQTLKELYASRGDEIENWLASKRSEAVPFVYTSVDLRHSRLRVVPVDTNLFPAGFNNLSPRGMDRASRFLARHFQDDFPEAKRVLIIPENHTRNLFYLENLAVIKSLFEAQGLEVQIGSLAVEKGEVLELKSHSGKPITQHHIMRDGNKVALKNGFVPDVVVVNNDMTSGSPDILHELEQPVIPPVGMGWYRRRKSVHFDMYKQLSTEFCEAFGLDPWLLSAEFHSCGLVDFKDRSSLECVAKSVEDILTRARAKHEEYGIKDDPYVFIKADSGTYGMGIMTVKTPEEIFELNKKDRNKMQTIKEGTRVSEIIIQEGVPTVDVIDDKVAEPMIYMIDGVPVGGMWRVNEQRDNRSNLNAAGMSFTGMCDETEDECGEWKSVQDCHFRSFGLVAALAALAAAREQYETPKQEMIG
ncbi:MAG: glutamate--cysteine ligase [Rickettsiales bacterium]